MIIFIGDLNVTENLFIDVNDVCGIVAGRYSTANAE
jgi:hypothetical protein